MFTWSSFHFQLQMRCTEVHLWCEVSSFSTFCLWSYCSKAAAKFTRTSNDHNDCTWYSSKYVCDLDRSFIWLPSVTNELCLKNAERNTGSCVTVYLWLDSVVSECRWCKRGSCPQKFQEYVFMWLSVVFAWCCNMWAPMSQPSHLWSSLFYRICWWHFLASFRWCWPYDSHHY